jgi:hypothetical protein
VGCRFESCWDRHLFRVLTLLWFFVGSAHRGIGGPIAVPDVTFSPAFSDRRMRWLPQRSAAPRRSSSNRATPSTRTWSRHSRRASPQTPCGDRERRNGPIPLRRTCGVCAGFLGDEDPSGNKLAHRYADPRGKYPRPFAAPASRGGGETSASFQVYRTEFGAGPIGGSAARKQLQLKSGVAVLIGFGEG